MDPAIPGGPIPRPQVSPGDGWDPHGDMVGALSMLLARCAPCTVGVLPPTLQPTTFSRERGWRRPRSASWEVLHGLGLVRLGQEQCSTGQYSAMMRGFATLP